MRRTAIMHVSALHGLLVDCSGNPLCNAVMHVPVLYIPSFESNVAYQLTRQKAIRFIRLLEYLIEHTVGSVQRVEYVEYAMMP